MIAEQLTQQAIQLSLAGQHTAACQTFTEITLLRPNDSGAWLNLGVCCMTLADLPAAANAFAQVIKLDPLNVAAYANLASTWASRGDLETAITVLDNGLHLTQAPLLRATKGALLAQIGEVDAAIELLTEAHLLMPQDFAMALILAELLVQQQRFTQALPILNMQAPPQPALLVRSYLARGRAFYGCGELEKAKAAFTQAKNVGSTEADALLQQLARGWGAPIASKRLLMQPLHTTNAAQIVALQADKQAWTFYNPQGIAASNASSIAQEISRRYESPVLFPKELAWIVYRQGIGQAAFIGLCQLVDIDHRNRRAELLMILQDRNKGYGVEALLMLANTFFNQYGLNKLVSLVMDTNTAVWDMELRLGFKQEGHLQQHLFNPTTQEFSGLVQLSLFKADFEQSGNIKRLIKRFEI